MRDCDRCDQQLLLTVTLPALEPGQPADIIGLCARCDSDSGPAARALIAYQLQPRDVWDDREHMRLAVEWMNEVHSRRHQEEESFTRWEAELAADVPPCPEPPGPLSPEAEQRILGLYSRLVEEEADRSTDPGQD